MFEYDLKRDSMYVAGSSLHSIAELAKAEEEHAKAMKDQAAAAKVQAAVATASAADA